MPMSRWLIISNWVDCWYWYSPRNTSLLTLGARRETISTGALSSSISWNCNSGIWKYCFRLEVGPTRSQVRTSVWQISCLWLRNLIQFRTFQLRNLRLITRHIRLQCRPINRGLRIWWNVWPLSNPIREIIIMLPVISILNTLPTRLKARAWQTSRQLYVPHSTNWLLPKATPQHISLLLLSPLAQATTHSLRLLKWMRL